MCDFQHQLIRILDHDPSSRPPTDNSNLRASETSSYRPPNDNLSLGDLQHQLIRIPDHAPYSRPPTDNSNLRASETPSYSPPNDNLNLVDFQHQLIRIPDHALRKYELAVITEINRRATKKLNEQNIEKWKLKLGDKVLLTVMNDTQVYKEGVAKSYSQDQGDNTKQLFKYQRLHGEIVHMSEYELHIKCDDEILKIPWHNKDIRVSQDETF